MFFKVLPSFIVCFLFYLFVNKIECFFSNNGTKGVL